MRLRAAVLAATMALSVVVVPTLVVAAPVAAQTTVTPLKAVLLGDSYSAGNGADHYYGPKGCYRSTENWAEQYLDTLRSSYAVTFVNRACSGGVLQDFTQRTKKDDKLVTATVVGNVGKDDPRARAALDTIGACSTKYRDDEEYDVTPSDAFYDVVTNTTSVWFTCARYLKAQWEAVGKDTDLVMFSVGGNDVEFASIIENCFALGLRDVPTCREKIEAAQINIGTVGERIEVFLRELKLRMRPDARIVLKSYPYLEKDAGYKLRNLLDSYEVGKEIRELGDLGDEGQSKAVTAVNAEGGAQVTFVSGIKPHFHTHEPDGRVCCENEQRWVHEFDGPIKMEWYHYNPRGHTEVAAVLGTHGDFGVGSGTVAPLGSVDITFVVDTTGSMGGAIDSVKAAATSLVNAVTARTTSARFSLVDYRDFASRTGDAGDYPSMLRQDFTSDAATINTAIQALTLGYGGDTPETMYSGIAEAFDLTWRPGVKKMAIVLADAPPLSPEPFTGLTGSDIVQRSLAIDPVEMHFVDISGYSASRPEIADMAARTNGGIYRTVPSQAATEIAEVIDASLDRPYAWAAGPYVGKTGEAHSLDGSGSFGVTSPVVLWEWDVDGDGVYDYSSDSPTATHTYSEEYDGLIALRVTDGQGRTSLATVPAHASVDGDEVPSAVDNCPVDANHGQEDYDGDGMGDVCDPETGYPTADKPGVSDSTGPDDPDGNSSPGSVSEFARPHFTTASRIESADDAADWFGVEHPGGRLQAQLIGLPADYDLVLADLAGTALATSAQGGKRSEDVTGEHPAGRYLLGVLPKPGEFSATKDYRLNVTVLGKGSN